MYVIIHYYLYIRYVYDNIFVFVYIVKLSYYPSCHISPTFYLLSFFLYSFPSSSLLPFSFPSFFILPSLFPSLPFPTLFNFLPFSAIFSFPSSSSILSTIVFLFSSLLPYLPPPFLSFLPSFKEALENIDGILYPVYILLHLQHKTTITEKSSSLKVGISFISTRVVGPNFGHPVQSSDTLFKVQTPSSKLYFLKLKY